MSATRIQVALVIALALFAAFQVGCADSRPERSRTAQAEESSTPHTPTPIAPQRLVVATPTGVSPTTLPTPFVARIESSPTAPPVVPTPTSIPTPTAPASQSSAAPGSGISIDDHSGQSLLKERINKSDVIARVRLQSVEPAVAGQHDRAHGSGRWCLRPVRRRRSGVGRHVASGFLYLSPVRYRIAARARGVRSTPASNAALPRSPTYPT